MVAIFSTYFRWFASVTGSGACGWVGWRFQIAVNREQSYARPSMRSVCRHDPPVRRELIVVRAG